MVLSGKGLVLDVDEDILLAIIAQGGCLGEVDVLLATRRQYDLQVRNTPYNLQCTESNKK